MLLEFGDATGTITNAVFRPEKEASLPAPGTYSS